MENRMSKTELLELIKTLKVKKEEFWIVSSGSLVLRDILPSAGDLDFITTKKGLEELKVNYDLIEKENGGYIINERVECVAIVEKSDLPYPLEESSGYYVQNILEYYDYLKTSKREKDIARIPLVEDYISKQNTN